MKPACTVVKAVYKDDSISGPFIRDSASSFPLVDPFLYTISILNSCIARAQQHDVFHLLLTQPLQEGVVCHSLEYNGAGQFVEPWVCEDWCLCQACLWPLKQLLAHLNPLKGSVLLGQPTVVGLPCQHTYMYQCTCTCGNMKQVLRIAAPLLHHLQGRRQGAFWKGGGGGGGGLKTIFIADLYQ